MSLDYSPTSHLGPLAMATFPLDPRDHSGEHGQLGEGAEGNHTFGAVNGQGTKHRASLAHWGFLSGKMKVSKKMALMAFSSEEL